MYDIQFTIWLSLLHLTYKQYCIIFFSLSYTYNFFKDNKQWISISIHKTVKNKEILIMKDTNRDRNRDIEYM